MRYLCLVVVVLAASCRSAPPPKPAAAPNLTAPALRLPEGIAPTAYTLNLTVVPGEVTFGGEISIELDASRAFDVLWLNGTALSVSEAQFTAGVTKTAARVEVHGTDFLAVVPASPLPAGKYTLRLVYSGLLSHTEVLGLFQLEDQGQSYAVTQFEPMGARRAFPCFDEPQFKVPWKISLAVKADQLAFSNAPIESESPAGAGIKLVTFKPTQPLPTYLVAIAVGPWEIVEAGTAGTKKTPLRIITPKGRSGQAPFAVAESAKILEALEAYFGTPYPYDKLDQLALPVRYGAMEHPGLVTYGYQTLLSRPEEDSPNRQIGFHVTAAHELSHMWFGNLVTMKWWDDLWLNESFAEWLMWKISSGLHPEWNLPVSQVKELGAAFRADSLMSARKVRQPIANNDDIVGAFDDITYSKGSSVLAQFESWLGPEVFQKGVRAHLAAHPFGTATADEFLAELSKAAGKDVGVPIKTFLDQAGAPKVKVTIECEAGKPVVAKLKQSRDLPLGSKAEAAALWQIPVCLRWGTKPDERGCSLLVAEEDTVPLTTAKGCPAWVVANDDFHGYYQSALTLPGKSLVASTQSALEAKSTSRHERVGLLDGLGALATSGDLELGEALSILPAALKTDQPEVWGQAGVLAASVNSTFVSDALRPKYERWIQQSFGARAKKLSLKVGAKDDPATRRVRPELVWLVGGLGQDVGLKAEAQKLAVAWLGSRSAVHPDVLSTVLNLAANGADPSVHARLLAAIKDEKDQQARAWLVGAMASVRDSTRLSAHFELLRQETTDLKESYGMLTGPASDPRTREATWQFLEQNFDGLVKRLPSDWVASLAQLGAGFCDDAHRQQVDGFFGPRAAKFVGMPHELAQTLEGIDLCIAQKARQEASLVKVLK